MRRAVLAASLFLAIACQEQSTASRPPPPALPSGTSAALSVHDAAGAAGPYRIGKLGRLVVDVRYTSEERGVHDVRVDVYTPRGKLYAQLKGSVEVDAAGTGSTSQPLEVQGTAIESFHQVGKWRFLVAVDGGAPLASAEVELTE
jgi:hypothetical protein